MSYINSFTDPSKIHEQLFIGFLWSNPSFYEKYKKHKISRGTFTDDVWHFYYYIGKEMFDNGIRTFDDVTVYSFLTSRPKLKGKKSLFDEYDNYGGYDVIEELIEECKKDKSNDEYHFSEIQKYETLRRFQDDGLLNTADKKLIEKLLNMTLKQMQMFFQHKHAKAFSHINSGEVVEHNLIDNLEETIDKLNAGEQMGLEFHDSPRLNRKIKGRKLGDLMYLVLSSGTGKTSWSMEKWFLSILENDEKGMIFGNEENVERFRYLMLATVCSKILKTPINREKLLEGNFDEKTLEKLKKAKEWLYKHKRDAVKFFELKKYRVEDVISKIELYRALGYKYIFLDTFKPDMSAKDTARWEAFSNSAQNLYDCIKADSNNANLLATVQLKIGKEYRFLDLSTIGKSLEIVEVASVVLLGRLMYSDEYPQQKNALKPYNWVWNEFTERFEKRSFNLNPNKKYLILFIAKNRHGSVDEQILYEVNYDINAWKEVAYVNVPRTSNVA